MIQLLNDPAASMPAQSFLVAGPQYPSLSWSQNVRRIEHVPPAEHPAFYSSSRFTLNVTRADMVEAGYSPSVRLFEAAACGAPLISDRWRGIETFFEPGKHILLADSTEDVVSILTSLSEVERRRMAEAARQQVLERHSSEHRALEFEEVVNAAYSRVGNEQRATAVR